VNRDRSLSHVLVHTTSGAYPDQYHSKRSFLDERSGDTRVSIVQLGSDNAHFVREIESEHGAGERAVYWAHGVPWRVSMINGSAAFKPDAAS
jgi:hypothetical protein